MLAIENILQKPAIEAYAQSHTQPEPKLLQHLIQETTLTTPGANMLTGRVEGRLLKLLVSISNAKRVLEIGTFTGYSALCMAEALPNHGELVTCEISKDAAAIAQKYFNKSPHGHKIKLILAPALQTINQLPGNWDLVFVDADKEGYDAYYEAVLPKLTVGSLIVFDNMLWGGEVLAPVSKQGIALDQLNKKIQADPRVENVLLTVRDGINIVRKIG